MINPGDTRKLIQELKTQGWQVLKANSGHYQAIPPTKGAAIVHFSASRDPRAWHNMFSQLRKSGFVEEVESAVRHANEHTICPQCQGAFDATLGVCMGKCTEPEEIVEPSSIDQLFVKLKEAKDWHAVAEQDLVRLKVELVEAQKRVDQAIKVRADAAGTLAAAKKNFDAAFNGSTT